MCQLPQTSSLKHIRRSLYDITTTMMKMTCITRVFRRDPSQSLSTPNLAILASEEDLNLLPRPPLLHLSRNPRNNNFKLIRIGHFYSPFLAGWVYGTHVWYPSLLMRPTNSIISICISVLSSGRCGKQERNVWLPRAVWNTCQGQRRSSH